MMGLREYELNYLREKYVQEAERERLLCRISQKPEEAIEEIDDQCCQEGLYQYFQDA